MNKTNIKTIITGILIALGSFYLITFIETILNFSMGISFKKPLSEYLLWGYSPIVLSGVYVGFSKATRKIIIGIIIGLLFRLSLWLILDVLIPAPYFDHSFSPLSFGVGVARNSVLCGVIAWGSYKLIQRRRNNENSQGSL
jgi:hypothetical protein